MKDTHEREGKSVDLRRVSKPVRDRNVESERRFWFVAIGGLIVLGVITWTTAEFKFRSSVYREHSRFTRFNTDNANGASANAAERIADTLNAFDHGSSLMRLIEVCLLWLIFLALVRINATIKEQTDCMLAAAERGNVSAPNDSPLESGRPR